MEVDKQLKEVVDRVSDPLLRLYYAILLELGKKVPDLKWIDLDHGQLEDPENGYQLVFPCCLIDFPGANWKDIGEMVQDGDVTVQFRIAFNKLNDFNNLTPDQIRVKGLEQFATVNKLYKKMQGFHGDFFNRLCRINSEIEKGMEPYKVFKVLFDCKVLDATAQKEFTEEQVTGTDITVSIPT